MRPERAIGRHWHLVMLAFTFSLLMGAPAAPLARTTPAAPLTPAEAGEKKGGQAGGERIVWAATLRQVRQWRCPWARVQLYWKCWSRAAPPPELAALLDHVARSLPLPAPT